MLCYLKNFALVCCFLGTLQGCRPVAPVVQRQPDNFVVPKVEILLLIPEDSTHAVYHGLRYVRHVYQFYKTSGFKPAWNNDGPSFLLDSVVAVVENARLHGLLRQHYHAKEINDLKFSSERISRSRRDVLLTDAFLSLANDVKFGRMNAAIVPLNHDSLNVQVLLEARRSGRVEATLRMYEPQVQQYQQLRKSLETMIDAADSASRAALLAGTVYGVSPVFEKVQCIEVNLERWRMESVSLGTRYIWINIPAYQLRLTDNGMVALESRVIVGKRDTPTPTLSSQIECITLYPYWHVPRKIAVEEFLPEIKKDTSFLSRNNFQVLDRKGNILNKDSLNWTSYTINNFPFTLRQREGTENSLGVIKFVFDNPYQVFLHDTNAKGLFRKENRALSHGCIRLEKARELAGYLASGQERIDKILKLKLKQTITLPRPIPIYVRYYTCESIDGILHFYKDLYQKDRAMINFLYGLPSGAGL